MAHRELAVSWLERAVLLAGEHQLDLAEGEFAALEVGCGQGVNLLLNAAAHPRARFFGLDRDAGAIAALQLRARELGVSNVTAVAADLRDLGEAAGANPDLRDWPAGFDLVMAHGVASWVHPSTREALIAIAAQRLRPGGLFACSYNTTPGWLARSCLTTLAVENGLRAGGRTTREGILAAAATLQQLLGPEAAPHILGREFPSLGGVLEDLQGRREGYLVAEYHASQQALPVGEMHRLCASHGLMPVGSATLPEMFLELLDPERRSVVQAGCDPAMRQVLLDLAIRQSFRRDLFARGVRPPAPAWRRQSLAACRLRLGEPKLEAGQGFRTSFGTLKLPEEFCSGLRQLLEEGPLTLGELAASSGEAIERLLPPLAVLITHGSVLLLPDPVNSGRADAAAVDAFNSRLISRLTDGRDGLEVLLSPVTHQPVSISLLEAFFLQVVSVRLPEQESVDLVHLGMGMAGATLRDAEGRPLTDPAEATAKLLGRWRSFQSSRLPGLVRLGLASPPP